MLQSNYQDNPEALQQGQITLRDGRAFSYCIYGNLQGDPVYFFHGFPGSRIQAALIADMAKDANLCLVATDRPGFGNSEHSETRTILSLAEDISELADSLGHEKFGVLGVSCGGPYALACAYKLAERVTHIGLMGGVGPMDMTEINGRQMRMLKIMFSLARINPLLVAPLLAMDRFMFRRDPDRAVAALSKLLTAPDQEFLRKNPDKARTFGLSLADAYLQGKRGPMREAFLIASARKFSMTEISQPADIFQGAFDRHVPPEMGEYIAAQLPNSEYHFHEREGHMSIVVSAFSEYVERFRYWHEKATGMPLSSKPAPVS